jgi:hypothetical protein
MARLSPHTFGLASGYAVLPPAPIYDLSLTAVASSGLTSPLGGTLTWNWQVGTAPPTPRSVAVVLDDSPTPFTVSITTKNGGNWLSASPLTGTSCPVNLNSPYDPAPVCPDSSKVTFAVDASKLGPGAYTGTITIQPQSFYAAPLSAAVTLNVSASSLLFVDESPVLLPGKTPKIEVSGNSAGIPFSVSAKTQSGVSWLSATPIQGVTPATLVISADPLAAPPGDSGAITISGPSNTRTIPVSCQVQALPASLQFSARSGEAAQPPQAIGIASALSVSTHTDDGANWLTAGLPLKGSSADVIVSVDAHLLPPGVYHGAVNVTTSVGPAQVPVTLTVWTGDRPAITVDRAQVSITIEPGALVFPSYTPDSTFTVSTGGIPLEVNASAQSSGWLGVFLEKNGNAPDNAILTPATVTARLTVDGSRLPLGTYHGSITVTAPPGSSNSAVVGVTLTVIPLQPLPGAVPLVSALLNAASDTAGPIAPGEILSIFGQNIGPRTPASTGTQVLFDGISAPVLYTSSTQVTAIVPYEVSKNISMIELRYNNASIPAGGAPLAAAALPLVLKIANAESQPGVTIAVK